jgi:hypothetical protein
MRLISRAPCPGFAARLSVEAKLVAETNLKRNRGPPMTLGNMHELDVHHRG